MELEANELQTPVNRMRKEAHIMTLMLALLAVGLFSFSAVAADVLIYTQATNQVSFAIYSRESQILKLENVSDHRRIPESFCTLRSITASKWSAGSRLSSIAR